jgi:hypothetical protein
MTYEGFGEMFDGDSADMCTGKFSIMLMGGRAEGLACEDPGVRTPIGVSGNLLLGFFLSDQCIEMLSQNNIKSYQMIKCIICCADDLKHKSQGDLFPTSNI